MAGCPDERKLGTSLMGRKPTDTPIYWYAADREHTQVFVHELKVWSATLPLLRSLVRVAC